MVTQLLRSHPSSMRAPHMAGSSLHQPPHLNSNGLYKRLFNSIPQSQPITGGVRVPNERPRGQWDFRHHSRRLSLPPFVASSQIQMALHEVVCPVLGVCFRKSHPE